MTIDRIVCVDVFHVGVNGDSVNSEPPSSSQSSGF